MSQMPPPPLNYQTPSAPEQNLREVASRQRSMMWCLLGYIALVIAQFTLPVELRPFVGIAAIALSITASVFVFMLAIKLFGTGVGILLGILTLIPFFGLIALLIVNQKATNLLKQNGVRVGFMGADLATLPDAR